MPARPLLPPAPTPRPHAVAVGAGALAVIAVVVLGAPRVAAWQASGRADAALEALVHRFWDPARATFLVGPGGPPAAYWVSAQALDAVLDGLERTGDPRWASLARSFVAAQAARGFRRDFFDDESWMALALGRFAVATGDAAAAARADDLLGDIEREADDRSCCGTRPGGLWWDRAHTQKATAANAGAVIAAARAYQRTGDPRHLAFARRVFAYWSEEMVDPARGQVADHLEPSGRKVWWRFTYNEGTMVGAALALHRATGEAAYLDVARELGRFVVARETAATARGPVLSDGSSCAGDCELFKGITQRYLAALAAADPGGDWDGVVRADASALWGARDARTTTFGSDWLRPPAAVTVGTQASAAMALGAAAASARRAW